MSYNINTCFDLVGRVEVLLGKFIHYGFSIIRHPHRQDWKCDKLTERNILKLWKTYCISFFAYTAKSTFEDMAISTVLITLSEKILY